MRTKGVEWTRPLAKVRLEGDLVRLEPLAMRHEAELKAIYDDARIWRHQHRKVDSAEGLRDYLAASLKEWRAGTALPFVVRSVESGRLVGMTRLKNMVRENRRATVGSWYCRAAWGTGANTEAKLLLLQHGFEVLGCVRVEFHTDRLNARSRAALKKLGAVEEGILRADVLKPDGRRRDTVMYSVIDTEWPKVKRRLQRGVKRALVEASGQAEG
ncbi:MAG: GNAT family protein [Acidobacteriaceae bacterium]